MKNGKENIYITAFRFNLNSGIFLNFPFFTGYGIIPEVEAIRLPGQMYRLFLPFVIKNIEKMQITVSKYTYMYSRIFKVALQNKLEGV